MMERLLIWRGTDRWFAEAATVELDATGLRATGTQLGTDPVDYRLDYTLDAAQDFITRSLSVKVSGEGWSRRVLLAHDGTGGWRCESEHHGDVDLLEPGGDPRALASARDCDLGFSPLTNLMPIRRHALHDRPGSADLLVARVSVPDLGVLAYPQRYEHIRTDAASAVVRFTSLGIHEGFTSDLELDRDGAGARVSATRPPRRVLGVISFTPRAHRDHRSARPSGYLCGRKSKGTAASEVGQH